MSTPTGIETAAPIVVRKQVTISAPVARVWALHTAPVAYPDWQHAITDVGTDGPFAVGRSFTWTSYGFTVTSDIYEVDPLHRTLWGGSADGITGVHEWRFTAIGDDTVVETDESWSGPAVDAALEPMRSALNGSLDTWVANLKTAAEDR